MSYVIHHVIDLSIPWWIDGVTQSTIYLFIPNKRTPCISGIFAMIKIDNMKPLIQVCNGLRSVAWDVIKNKTMGTANKNFRVPVHGMPSSICSHIVFSLTSAVSLSEIRVPFSQ